MRLIFLARKVEAETGSILQTEPNQQHRNMGLMVSGDFCSLGFCFGFAALKENTALDFLVLFDQAKRMAKKKPHCQIPVGGKMVKGY